MLQYLRSAPPFKDLWVRIVTSLVLSFFFVFLGNSTLEDLKILVQGKLFLSDFISGFLLSFILITFISHLTVYLGKYYPWTDNFSTRFARQFLLGVAVPSVFAFIFMYVLLIVINELTLEEVSFFFEIEFPIIVLIIILWNLIYIGYFYYHDSRKVRHELIALQNELYVLKNLENIESTSEEYSEELPSPTSDRVAKEKIKMFIAISGNRNIPIPVEDIAYIHKVGNVAWLKTYNKETYQLNHTLEDLMSILQDDLFFRANRQCIINLKSCHYFTNEEGGKLAVHLNPPHEDEVMISQKRAPIFKEWLNK